MPLAVLAGSDEISAQHRQSVEARHGFLPIHASVEVSGKSSTITLVSLSNYDLDILVRVGKRAFLIPLVPNGNGSAGTLIIPEPLSLPAPVRLLACLRSGDEQ